MRFRCRRQLGLGFLGMPVDIHSTRQFYERGRPTFAGICARARGRSFDSLDVMSCGGDGFTVSNFVLLYITDFTPIVRIRSNNGARKVTS